MCIVDVILEPIYNTQHLNTADWREINEPNWFPLSNKRPPCATIYNQYSPPFIQISLNYSPISIAYPFIEPGWEYNSKRPDRVFSNQTGPGRKPGTDRDHSQESFQWIFCVNEEFYFFQQGCERKSTPEGAAAFCNSIWVRWYVFVYVYMYMYMYMYMYHIPLNSYLLSQKIMRLIPSMGASGFFLWCYID